MVFQLGSKVLKHSSCSTQLRLKIILLINVKMPTIITFIIRICILNLQFQYAWAILAIMSSVEHENIFITLGPGEDYTDFTALTSQRFLCLSSHSVSAVQDYLGSNSSVMKY